MSREVIIPCRGKYATQVLVASELWAVALHGLGTACVSPSSCPLAQMVQVGEASFLSPPAGPHLTPRAVEPSCYDWYLPWVVQ